MVNTTYGEMDETGLRRVEGLIDDENEHTTWIEYWLSGELVHRSAHVTLKKGIEIFGEIQNLGA